MTDKMTRLVGVYDADHTWRGELAYFVGARLGRRHCALCDVTHGLVRERSEWKTCRSGLPVAFDTYHRDDQPAAVRDAAAGRAPVVLAETTRGYTVLLEDATIALCEGDPSRLVAAISVAVTAAGLSWPSSTAPPSGGSS